MEPKNRKIYTRNTKKYYSNNAIHIKNINKIIKTCFYKYKRKHQYDILIFKIRIIEHVNPFLRGVCTPLFSSSTIWHDYNGQNARWRRVAAFPAYTLPQHPHARRVSMSES